jgi:hypothetical protein
MVCQVLGQKICLTMFYFLKPFWKVLGPGGCPPRPRGLVFLFIFRMNVWGKEKVTYTVINQPGYYSPNVFIRYYKCWCHQ